MAEHLGVLTKKAREAADWDHNLLDDPVCNEFFQKVWCKFAESNMKIFDDVNDRCGTFVTKSLSVARLCNFVFPLLGIRHGAFKQYGML